MEKMFTGLLGSIDAKIMTVKSYMYIIHKKLNNLIFTLGLKNTSFMVVQQ